jgi:hypothetical protein
MIIRSIILVTGNAICISVMAKIHITPEGRCMAFGALQVIMTQRCIASMATDTIRIPIMVEIDIPPGGRCMA